jgi:oligoribonuclease NrnB/cAMP/cGMP phosphodiesterase (DHH superfamily)
MNKRVAVLYHSPCVDGAFAAYAAKLALGEEDVVYCGHNVNAAFDLERIRHCSHVVLLDYIGPEGFAEQLAATRESVTVVDHHKTAQASLDALRQRPNVEVVFDLERSGATLALAHFAPEVSEEMRQCFALVEDNDLWRHALPESRAFSAGLRRLLDLERESLLDDVGKLSLAAVLAAGAEELQLEARRVQVREGAVREMSHSVGEQEELERRYVVQIGEARLLAVDAQFPTLRSTVGNELAALSQAAGLAPAAAVCYADSGVWKVSLRSLGDWDTTALSTRFGGGGHRNASSFAVDRTVWDSWKA